MEAKDLMIGDWVKFDGKNLKVLGYHHHFINLGNGNDIVFGNIYIGLEPIPITEEFLLKNGFKMMDKSEITEYCRLLNDIGKGGMICIYWHIKENRLFFEYMKKGYSLGTVMLQDACVHQLQHFLRLCNIDLEIEL